MTDSKPSREELRQRLRSKINNARTPSAPHSIAQQMRKDPTGALMQMGIDDAELLKSAPKMMKNPKQFIESGVAEILKTTGTNDKNISEDDEAPPPPAAMKSTDRDLPLQPSNAEHTEATSDDEAPPPLANDLQNKNNSNSSDDEAPPPLCIKLPETYKYQ